MLPSRRVLIVAGLCAVITASGCTSSGEKDTVAKGGPAGTAFQQVSFMSAEIPAGNTERTFDHVVLQTSKTFKSTRVVERTGDKLLLEFDASDASGISGITVPESKTPVRVENTAGPSTDGHRRLAMRSLVGENIDLSQYPKFNELLTALPMGMAMQGTR